MLAGKRILVGISGGIAAYKIPQLVRLLVKEGAEVQCVPTPHALQFVTQLTLETLSNRKVYTDLFDVGNDHATEHIALKDWGDAMVIAPATANVIGKLSAGIADDALSTLMLAFRKPMLLCPAMNDDMWNSPVVCRNIKTLRNDGCHIVDPGEGALACGSVGTGRMAEPDEIKEALTNLLMRHDTLAGRRVLVTAGPTYERIDAVRFVGNFSTGKMGFAVADALARRGADVVLIAGPTQQTINHSNVHRIDVVSAQEMYAAAVAEYPSCQAAVLAAAVADYRPEHAVDTKIKKQDQGEHLSLTLVPTPDILATLGLMKRPDQYLVGFALETNDELAHARQKLQRKNLDFIVLNSLNDAGAGFGCDTNKVTFLTREGQVTTGQLKSKLLVAEDIVDRIVALLR